MTSARIRRKRQNKPSAPRQIGANDNEITGGRGFDDRDRQAISVAKARAAREATKLAQDDYERLLSTGVEAHISGAMVSGKRVGGLEWLFRKDRITLTQYRAGTQYGEDFSKAEDPTLRSCLNDRVGGEPQPMQETKQAAAERLLAARAEALLNHEGLIGLMDAVCGHGSRIRTLVNGDDAEAAKRESQLALGLDFLARHYGML